MGGFSRKIFKRDIVKEFIKPVAKPKPVAKSKPAPKKVDTAREAEELKLANKRKGRRATIKTTSSGLNDEEIKKKTLLG